MSFVPIKGLPKKALDKVVFRGRLMDNLTMWFLLEMEEKLGYPLTVVQGCYAQKVTASGTTHNGGGVVDLAAYKWHEKVQVGADLGGWPFHRLEKIGVWGEHIHMGVRNHPALDPIMAIRQQNDWDSTPPRDGLAGHNLLRGQYHPGKEIQFDWKEALEAPMTDLEKMKDELVQSIHSLQNSIAIGKGIKDRPVIAATTQDLKELRRKLKIELETLPPK